MIVPTPRFCRATLVAASLLVAVPALTAGPAVAGRTRRDIPPSDTQRLVQQDIPFNTLQRGLHGAWAAPELFAARSEREWVGAMAAMAARGDLIVSQQPSPPKINWSRQMVVLVALGRLDGYSVEIKRVSHIGRWLYVEVSVAEAARSGDVDVSPYHLIVLNSKPAGDLKAHYNWPLPGLPTGPSDPTRDIATAAPSLLSVSAENAATPTSGTDRVPMSWGRLKRLYR